jgi:predicted phage tail protein
MSDPTLTGGAEGAAYIQTAAGAVLLATPFWAQLLSTVNMVAGAVASVCGAVVGLIGVWRIFRPKRGV